MCARDPKASGWFTARREAAVSGDVVTASHHARIGYPMTSIIILNHNGRKHVEVCLASVAALTDVPYELIVIDNGSTDGSVEYLRSVEVASMTLIENPENIGCPPARAQGMCLAGGDYVLFLDNDTHVTPGWLRRLVEHCEDNPEVGVLGPTTNYAGGPQQLPQAEVTYSDTDSLAVFATDLAKRLRGSLVSRRRIIGFCMLIRRAVVDRVGNCDGRFGKYGYEDDDYCWRALLAGYQVGIARDVFIHHVGGQGSPGGADDYDEMLPVAWAEFRDKWALPETMDPDGYWTLISTYGLHRTFDPERDYIPLPNPSSVADLITRTPTR
jgi:GT2 family glycosyltransferase